MIHDKELEKRTDEIFEAIRSDIRTRFKIELEQAKIEILDGLHEKYSSERIRERLKAGDFSAWFKATGVAEWQGVEAHHTHGMLTFDSFTDFHDSAVAMHLKQFAIRELCRKLATIESLLPSTTIAISTYDFNAEDSSDRARPPLGSGSIKNILEI